MIYKLKTTRVYRAYLGGENLDKLNNENYSQTNRFPEDWLGSVTCAFNPGRDVANEGLTETEDGRFLKDIIEQNKEDMIGKREKMSLLFKLLDSSERLVIQAHPTVECAREYFDSDFGKTECWYILNDGGYVYIGFKEGITKEKWKDLFERQDIEGMLDALHRFDVKKGDFIFVAGGVPHAIGKDCFLCELQEPTDLMVIPERVTPSGNTLAEVKLHGGLGFEKMFDVFSYDGMSEEETKKAYFSEPKRKDECLEIIVDNNITDKFRFSKVTVSGDYTLNLDSYGIMIVTEGEINVNGINLKAGDRVFVSENEKILDIKGIGTAFVCQP